MKKKGVLVGVGKEVSISVTAEVTVADDKVRGMSPERRKCLLRPEIDTELYQMKMFNEYKKSSCLLECQAEELIKKYECLPYYMPALPKYFINEFKPENQSIDCTFSQLKSMANDIAKEGSESMEKIIPLLFLYIIFIHFYFLNLPLAQRPGRRRRRRGSDLRPQL